MRHNTSTVCQAGTNRINRALNARQYSVQPEFYLQSKGTKKIFGEDRKQHLSCVEYTKKTKVICISKPLILDGGIRVN